MKKLKYLLIAILFTAFAGEGFATNFQVEIDGQGNNVIGSTYSISNCSIDHTFGVNYIYTDYFTSTITFSPHPQQSSGAYYYASNPKRNEMFLQEYNSTTSTWVEIDSYTQPKNIFHPEYLEDNNAEWDVTLASENKSYRVKIQKIVEKWEHVYVPHYNDYDSYGNLEDPNQPWYAILYYVAEENFISTLATGVEYVTFNLEHTQLPLNVTSTLTENGTTHQPNGNSPSFDICGPTNINLENFNATCYDQWIVYKKEKVNGGSWSGNVNNGIQNSTLPSSINLSSMFGLTPGKKYRIILKVGKNGQWTTPNSNKYTFDYKQSYTPTISGLSQICEGDNVTLQIQNYSGNPSGISWSSGQQNVDNITVSPNSTTIYNVTFTEACTQSPVAKTVIVNPLPTIDLSANNDTYCTNDPFNWNLAATPSGGTWTASSPWTSGIISPPSTFNGATVTTETVGDLTYTYTDGNGCTNSEDITISYFDEAEINMTVTDALCNGDNGTLSGITTVYPSSNWTVLTDPNETIVHQTNNLYNYPIGAGDYFIDIVDIHGCSNRTQATINEPAPITASLVQASVGVDCWGDQATATINTDPTTGISGGTAPYSYNFGFGWTPNTSATYGAIGNYSTYTISVTDANNCAVTPLSFSVFQPNEIIFNPSYTNAQCLGVSDGEITWNYNTANGGTGPLSFSMAGVGTVNSPIQGLASGQYTVYATDANGCSKTQSVTVGNNPTVFTLNGTPSSATCSGVGGGSISLAVNPNGGTGNNGSPYTYHWSNGDVTTNITGLQSGTYNVTVTGASGNGCVQTGSYQVGNSAASTWHKNTKNNAGQQDEVVKLLTDASGNVYTLGEFMEETVFDGQTFYAGAAGQKGIFITKHDQCGSLLWSVSSQYSGSGTIGVEAIDMQLDGTDLLVFGKYENDGQGNLYLDNQNLNNVISTNDVFRATINSLGIVQAFIQGDYFARDFQENITEIEQHGTDVYFAGAFGTTPYTQLYAGIKKYSSGFTNVIVDLNPNNIISAFEYDGTSVYAILNLTTTANIASIPYSVLGNSEALLIKYDGTNTTVLPANATTDVLVNDLILANGSLWTAGQFSGRLNSWGSPNVANLTGFVMKNSLNLNDEGFYYIDPNLVTTGANATALAANAQGLYVAGTFNGNNISIGNSSATTSPSMQSGSGVNDDLWVAKLDFTSNSFVWIEGSSSPEPVVVNAIAVDGTSFASNAFVGGSYANSITLPGVSLSHPLPGPTNNLGFVIREGDFITQGGQGMAYKNDSGNGTDSYSENSFENTLTNNDKQFEVFPNPNNGQFTLRMLGNEMGETNIHIYDITGRLLYSKKSNKENYLFEGKINIQGLQSGMYVISININGETKYQKFMIE